MSQMNHIKIIHRYKELEVGEILHFEKEDPSKGFLCEFAGENDTYPLWIPHNVAIKTEWEKFSDTTRLIMKLNKKQLREIETALEFYFRFFIGQPASSMELSSLAYERNKMEEFRAWKTQTKKLFWDLRPNESFSYKKKPTAYEILGKIEQALNKMDGIDNIKSYDPLKCTPHPFIEIKVPNGEAKLEKKVEKKVEKKSSQMELPF